MLKKILLILIVIFPINAHAQLITGSVSDTITQLKIPSTQVEIINNSTLQYDTVYSDSFGDWQFNLPTSVHEESNLPSRFTLAQNYPNPFNPSTKIAFSINEAGEVKLLIHDILGQQIDSRYQFLAPGNYQIKWSSPATAGVYFYTLQTGSFSETQKMIQLDGGSGNGLSNFESAAGLNQNNFLKSSSNDFTIITTKFGYIPDTMTISVSGGEHFNYTIETIHNYLNLIDLHNDVLEKMVDDPNYHLGSFHTFNHTDIPRMRLGGVDIQFFAVWVYHLDFPNNPLQRAQDMIDIFNAEMILNPDDIQQARTLSEAISINDEGKIAAVLAVEGGHTIENSIDNLINLYDQGVRYLTITWNNSTDWAVSAQHANSTTVGLSEFGRQVIRTMDSLGIIIDVSHTGIRTIQDILEETTNPIIATHSGVRALQNHYRNLYDWQIQDIANSGGVVGIVFYPPFLGSPSSSVDIETVIEHIDYIVNLVGIDYVAIGSDFDGIGTNTVNGLEDISKFPALSLALLEHGYTQADIEKILGGNFMRVFQQVCGDSVKALAAK